MTIQLNKEAVKGGIKNTPCLWVSETRQSLSQELHNRPSVQIAICTTISHIAVRISPDQREKEFQQLCTLCARYNAPPPEPDACCYYQHFTGFQIRWERHLEFSSYTFIRSGISDTLFDSFAIEFVPQQWFDELAGELVSAVNVVLTAVSPSEELLCQAFENYQVLGSKVSNGRANVFTSFRIHSDGFSRLYIQSSALNAYQAGRLVQRLLEIETYQMMALLSLPIAKALSADVAKIEQRLVVISQSMALINDADDGKTLIALSHLASQTEQILADISYRFSATNAYYDLVCSRITQLKEQDISNKERLSEFVTRRLSPGVKTCQALTRRLDALTCRIERASGLLRTRVDLSIEQQNQKLLAAINQRGEVQLRLQQIVEGVSIVAIVYYSMSLLDYVLNALASVDLALDKTLVKGAAVPVLLVFTWLVMRFLLRVIKNQTN
ncbi:DUF3422 domain-containing protein [Paraglaciecola polaris]|uniref:DUF3422 family protein n=1 Tax=Paraglaciecola polaris TaxID=222814 RepID=UPI0030ED5300|tara:strand:- start:1819 stop:3141 length:1323 start_codon:yes stop_codon:yes gene_type:complete